MEQAVVEIKYNAINRPYFVMKNQKGETIAVSESFSDRIDCERCIINVRENTAIAQEIPLGESGENPKFELREYLPGKFQFLLYSIKDEIILTSEPCNSLQECINRMKEFKESFVWAKIVDLL